VLGRDLAKSASGSAGERRKGLQIREETLFRALRGIGTLALLVNPCEEPRVLQQSLAHLGVGAAVGRIEGLPLARGEALGQLAGIGRPYLAEMSAEFNQLLALRRPSGGG